MDTKRHTKSLFTDFLSEKDASALICKIFDNMPVGLEIYDREGYLIYINADELNAVECSDLDSVLGINLFDNPNLPKDIARSLISGKEVRFSVDYDFNLVGNYYSTTGKNTRHLDVAVNIVFDEHNEIDKYILISKDNTEQWRLQRKYEALSAQNAAILESLPVGVVVCNSNGDLVFMNNAGSKMLGINHDLQNFSPVNILKNPRFPKELIDAVTNNTEFRIRFKYEPDSDSGNQYASSRDKNHSVYLECNGRPIIDTNGCIESYVFILDDVTQAAYREEQLRQSNLKTELALRDSGIILWEFDVAEKRFFSDNEPINNYNSLQPITIEEYHSFTHPEDLPQLDGWVKRMIAGEEFSFTGDARMAYPNKNGWQYCTINGLPYERDSDGRVLKYVGTRKNNTDIYQSKQLQSKILNDIPLSIHIKDVADNFKYVFCNNESKQMLGISENKTLKDVISPEQIARIEKTDKEVYNTGKPYFGSEHIVLKDGRIYDTIVRKSIIYDNEKRLLLNVRWDKSLQNELERRAKVLSLSLKAVNAYSWLWEPDKDKITYGEGFERNKRDLTQFDTFDKFIMCIHPEDRDYVRNSIDTIPFKDGGDWDIEYRADLNEEGVYEWWQTRGVLEMVIQDDVPYRYMFGMSINIDVHKQAELTLLRKKDELKKLIRQNELVLNNAGSGLAYITTDYIVQWENISMCSTGLSYEAYKEGEYCYKSAHNRNEPCENCVLQKAMHSRKAERIKFHLENGRSIEVYSTPVFNDDSSIDGIVIRIDDITERIKIDELLQAKLLAEQSDKLKSAFLANMSHEIRTPLNAIVGFSNLLVESTNPEEKKEFINIIQDNNELLLKVINDILDLSKIEAGTVELEYEDFNLSEYLKSIATSMRQRKTNPEVELMVCNPYSYCMVHLDKNRIAQIMINYVTNAIKYTSKGSIEMGYEAMEKGIRLFVRDTGIGIPESKREKVFQRFEKIDEFAQGTGLGLSICKAIAESMGGKVGFESKSNKGSLFWAFIPCDTRIDDTTDIEKA